jgi:hypothetical protein
MPITKVLYRAIPLPNSHLPFSNCTTTRKWVRSLKGVCDTMASADGSHAFAGGAAETTPPALGLCSRRVTLDPGLGRNRLHVALVNPFSHRHLPHAFLGRLLMCFHAYVLKGLNA